MTEDEITVFMEDFDKTADWTMIPGHMHQAVRDWIEHGWLPGSFLQAMLEHDVYDAVFRADNWNEGKIAEWCKFLCWYVPSACHGNEENVRDWFNRGGLRGKPK